MKFFSLKQIRSEFISGKIAFTTKDRRLKGILFTAFAWFLIAMTTPSYENQAYSLSFFNVCFYQNLVAFTTLALWASFKGKPHLFLKNPVGIVFNSILSVLCYIAYFTLRITPQQTSNSFVLNLDAIFVAFISAYFLKQKIHSYSWLGIFFCFIGVTCLYSLKVNFTNLEALFQGSLSLLAAIAIALLILSSNYLIRNQNSALVVCLYNCFAGIVFFGFIAWVTGLHIPSLQDMAYIGVSGVLYAVAICFFTSAHRYTEAYLIMPINYLIPIYLTIMDHFTGRNSLNVSSLFNTLIIGCGLVLTLIPAFYFQKESEEDSSSVDHAA